MSRLPLARCAKLRIGALATLLALSAVVAAPRSAFADLTLTGGGLVLAEQGGTFADNNLAGLSFGAIPFSSSDLGPELGIGFHVAANLNDGLSGNSNSWIGGALPVGVAVPFAGISLDGSYTLQSIAFGRDNGPSFLTDRALGLYTLQYTTAALVDASTPDASWTTIGTLNYASPGPGNFSNPALRHRYNFDAVANVTGVRLLVPGTGLGAGTAIDEIELYEMAGAIVEPPPPPPPFAITPASGHNITWDGNDGDHFDPTPPPTGSVVPSNLASASVGAIPFSSSDLGPEIPVPFHVKGNLNDGIYGNGNSWIPGSANPNGPMAGVQLDGLFYVNQIAWGRDNGNGAVDDSNPGTDACGGQCDDRYQGVYTLQYSQLPNADQTTATTGDPTTGWADIGTVNLTLGTADGPGGLYTGYLRHAFDVSANGQPIVASGIRLLVPGGTAIDELEVYGSAVPEPSTYALIATALYGLAVVRRRRR
jgi:hypothetical protein